MDQPAPHEPGTAWAAANILLDTLMAADPELGDHPANERAMKLALRRLGEVQAVSILRDDETDTPAVVDPGPLVSGALYLINQLILVLAQDHHAEPEAVVGTLREHLENFDR